MGYELALSSSDAAVKAAAQNVKREIAEGAGTGDMLVVNEVLLDHAVHCRSPAAPGLDDLAAMPIVQRLVVSAASHDSAMEAVRHTTGVQLAPHDVTRLAEKITKHIHEQREADYRLVLPFLEEMERNDGFGGVLVVRRETGDKAVVRYGRFKTAEEARPLDASLRGARMEHLLVMWPWASRVENLGPLIVGADAMHSKVKQGYIFNVSMRVAKRNVSLLTQ
jgi:hypothetical protein